MYYFVVNPAAKSGRSIKVWDEVRAVLDRRGVEYQVFFSKSKGDITALVRTITSAYPPDADGKLRLVLVGGDGTLNEAVQGVADYGRLLMGYIPAGSANDFADNAGIKKEPLAALEQILACKEPTRVDLGYMTYDDAGEDAAVRHCFTSSCGIGFDAAVSQASLVSGSKDFLNRLGLGDLIFVLMALKTLIHIKRGDCTLTLDGERVIKVPNFLLVISMIYRCEGGIFLFAPDAIPDDGKFDICVFGDLPKWKVLLKLPAAIKGTHLKYENVDLYRASTVHIHTSMPFWVQLDGEVSTQSTDITIVCNKEHLSLLK